MIGTSSPGKSYSERSSRISISTRSRSSSIVNEVALVHEYNDCRNANLTGEKDVFTSLLHRTVGSSNNEDSTVHLSSAGDHVLDVVGVAGAVNVSIVTLLSLILNVTGVDCDTTSLFLRERYRSGRKRGIRCLPFARERTLVIAAVRVVLPWST